MTETEKYARLILDREAAFCRDLEARRRLEAKAEQADYAAHMDAMRPLLAEYAKLMKRRTAIDVTA